jgi:hypothetical protein
MTMMTKSLTFLLLLVELEIHGLHSGANTLVAAPPDADFPKGKLYFIPKVGWQVNPFVT